MRSKLNWNPPWIKGKSKCPCCESSSFKHVFSCPDRLFKRTEPRYPINECGDCGAIVLMPEAEWNITEAYPDQYELHSQATRLSFHHRLFASYYFPSIPKLPSGPIIDMGCGTGLLVEYLSQHYPEVLGVEINPHAVEMACKFHRNVIQGNWQSFMPKSASVAALIMNHVIEHIPVSPDALFLKVTEILVDGGCFIIRTPNPLGWGRKHFGEHWHPIDAPRHLVLHTTRALKVLSRRYNLTVERITYCGKAYDLTKSVAYQHSEGIETALGHFIGNEVCLSPFARFLAFALNRIHKGDAIEVILRKQNRGWRKL